MPRFEDDGPLGAALLHDGLRRLARRFGANPPLNLWVRTAPRDAEHFCWRIDVVPRLTNVAGLELGTGVHLNIVAPEQAAAELRERLDDAVLAQRGELGVLDADPAEHVLRVGADGPARAAADPAGRPVSLGTTPVMDISPWTSSSCATSSPRSRNHGSS